MRFIMIVKANEKSEAGVMPTEEELATMNTYNQELAKAGILRDATGLHPTSQAARVKISGGKVTVTDGPFPETKDLIAGFWIIEVDSKQEAINWAKRIPAPNGEGAAGEVEIRQFFGLEDFAPGPAIDQARELDKKLAGSHE